MQFLTIYKSDQSVAGAIPTQEHMDAMREFVDESMKSGVLLTTGSFMSSAGGGSMRLSKGQFTAGGAPASQSETGGFAILKTQDEKELEGLVKRFLTLAGDGECQILRLNEFPQP
jgi:hypothetical protein